VNNPETNKSILDQDEYRISLWKLIPCEITDILMELIPCEITDILMELIPCEITVYLLIAESPDQTVKHISIYRIQANKTLRFV